jgi:hypothetical protein
MTVEKRAHLLCLFLALLVGCATQGELPKRFTSLEQDDQGIRVLGVGSGVAIADAQRAAIANAAGQLVNYFGFEGKTEVTSLRTETENRLREMIQQRAPEVRIVGSLLEEWTFRTEANGCTAWVIVRYPRSELVAEQERIRARDAEQRSAWIAGKLEADRALQDGDVLSAAEQYASMLREMGDDAPAEWMAPDIERALIGLVRSIRLERVSGDGQEGGSSTGLPEPLRFRALRDSRPISGMPVVVGYPDEDGSELGRFTTDQDGTAECRVSRLPSEPASGTIRARLDMVELLRLSAGDGRRPAALERARASAEATYLDFHYALKRVRPDLRLLVLIDERLSEGTPLEAIAGSALQEKLLSEGYRVSGDVEIGKTVRERIRQFLDSNQLLSVRDELYEMVDAVVWGTVEASRAERLRTGLWQSSAEGSIRCIDLTSGDIVSIASPPPARGIDKDASGAERAAMREYGVRAAIVLVEGLQGKTGH